MEELIKIEKMFFGLVGVLVGLAACAIMFALCFLQTTKNEGSLQGLNSQTMLAAEICLYVDCAS